MRRAAALLGVLLALGACDVTTPGEALDTCDQRVADALEFAKQLAADTQAQCDAAAQLAADQCQEGMDDLKAWLRAQAEAAGCVERSDETWDCSAACPETP